MVIPRAASESNNCATAGEISPCAAGGRRQRQSCGSSRSLLSGIRCPYAGPLPSFDGCQLALYFGKTVVPAKAVGTPNRTKRQERQQPVKRAVLCLVEQN